MVTTTFSELFSLHGADHCSEIMSPGQPTSSGEVNVPEGIAKLPFHTVGVHTPGIGVGQSPGVGLTGRGVAVGPVDDGVAPSVDAGVSVDRPGADRSVLLSPLPVEPNGVPGAGDGGAPPLMLPGVAAGAVLMPATAPLPCETGGFPLNLPTKSVPVRMVSVPTTIMTTPRVASLIFGLRPPCPTMVHLPA